jgi:hypothetical protein
MPHPLQRVRGKRLDGSFLSSRSVFFGFHTSTILAFCSVRHLCFLDQHILQKDNHQSCAILEANSDFRSSNDQKPRLCSTMFSLLAKEHWKNRMILAFLRSIYPE